MPGTERASVVVPVYRNAATLVALHEQLVPHASEIVFVVDASPDDSLAVLLALQQRSAIVKVVSMAANAGQTWALLVGLRYATGDPIVMMDADLQDPPSAIPSLLDALREADVVFAGRRGAYESSSRRLTSFLFKGAFSRLSRGRVPRDAGLFLAMRRSVVEHLLDCTDEKPYLISMIARGRFRMRSIPVARERSIASGYTFLRRLSVATRGFRGLLFPPSGGTPIRTRIDHMSHRSHS
jgi:glycosyltransferase involved in cell wall biosynthesis